MVIGLSPSIFAPLTWPLWLALILLNVNLTAAFLAMAVFSALAWLMDPVIHSLGYFILTGIPFLQPLWTALYNIPFVPLSGFNNTVVMGSFVLGWLLFLPMFFLMRALVIYYRENYDSKIEKWKIVKLIKGNKAYQWYQKIRAISE
ncbi:MAG: hypothetical protein Kow0037_23810 [Calditrichia bacterium]